MSKTNLSSLWKERYRLAKFFIHPDLFHSLDHTVLQYAIHQAHHGYHRANCYLCDVWPHPKFHRKVANDLHVFASVPMGMDVEIMSLSKKRSPACKLQVGLWFAFWASMLWDLNGLGDFLLRFGLRHGDGQDAVLDLGWDLVFHHIVW